MELTCVPIGDKATGFGSETLSSEEDYWRVDDSEVERPFYLSEIEPDERTLRATDVCPDEDAPTDEERAWSDYSRRNLHRWANENPF